MRHPARRTVGIPVAVLAATWLAGSGLARPASAQDATPAAEAAPLRVGVKTIEGDCKIGEGGAGLYRNASAHHSCGLYPAPEGTIFFVIDESGDGVNVEPANRGAKLNTPDGKTATCGRGSMLILAVITTTTEADGFQRADYDAACVAGPFPPHSR